MKKAMKEMTSADVPPLTEHEEYRPLLERQARLWQRLTELRAERQDLEAQVSRQSADDTFAVAVEQILAGESLSIAPNTIADRLRNLDAQIVALERAERALQTELDAMRSRLTNEVCQRLAGDFRRHERARLAAMLAVVAAERAEEDWLAHLQRLGYGYGAFSRRLGPSGLGDPRSIDSRMAAMVREAVEHGTITEAEAQRFRDGRTELDV